MNKRTVLSELRKQIKEAMYGFHELKGVIIYGSFPYPKSRPNDVDLLLVFEHPAVQEKYDMAEYINRIHRAVESFESSNAYYHVNRIPAIIGNVESDFGLLHIGKYIFIGDRATRKALRSYQSVEEVRI